MASQIIFLKKKFINKILIITCPAYLKCMEKFTYANNSEQRKHICNNLQNQLKIIDL